MKPCCPPDADCPPPADEAGADLQLAALAKAIAHPTRVAILRILKGTDGCIVSDLVGDWADVQRDVRAVVRLLMDLETRNGELLAGQRRGAETKMAGLEGAHRTLQRVHRSYAPEQPAAWHSYS